jgi:RNA polymerase sigma factor (sigma-70 family)
MDSDRTTRFLGRAVAGDPAALDALAQRLGPLLTVMAQRRLPAVLRSSYDEADLIQDVWVIVLRNLARLRTRDGRRTPVLIRYVRASMDLRIRTLLRREIYRTVHGADGIDGVEAIPDAGRRTLSVLAARELGQRLADDIGALQEPQRSIVYQRAIEQRPNHEVANRLGLPANTVAKTYQRELQRLQERWPDSVFADL